MRCLVVDSWCVRAQGMASGSTCIETEVFSFRIILLDASWSSRRFSAYFAQCSYVPLTHTYVTIFYLDNISLQDNNSGALNAFL